MKHVFLFGIVLFLVYSCSNSVEVEDQVHVADNEISGVELVKFSGIRKSVQLGSDAPEDPADERPSMKVVFDYDFSIGKHEVTCGEFLDVMSGTANYAKVVECKNKSLPVVNVNYFDAVLYVNALSKKKGMDTAYTYKEVSFDEGGCASILGLEFNSDVEAFRLPTEAEWMFAANYGWNVENGWTAENSDYESHEVCSLPANSAGVCDLLGNVAEWVGDWKSSLQDSTITNYAGGVNGGNVGERVLKGGSFRSEPSQIRISSRGDIYTVTSSMRAPYVGFRLAYGPFAAVVLDGRGAVAVERPYAIAPSSAVRKETKTYQTVLAFRNDVTGNLAYIDYSMAGLLITEIEDTLEVYHPEISPDGKKVAFCTGLEGVSGKSALYVRSLNATGSDLVRLDVESAAIPRWRVLDGGDTVIVYVTDAGNNKNETSFKEASTWEVPFRNGAFGTPRKLFDGAYHGGISENSRLAVTGARLLRARIEETSGSVSDTVWYNGEQACNASLSMETGRTAFLDFASRTGQEFVGSSYGVHERILVVDSTGKLVQSIAAPTGFTFDHVEWVRGKTSNTRNLLVATLADNNGTHGKIVLVNQETGEFQELIGGEELWHPSLWVKSFDSLSVANGLDVDSAGVYFSETGSSAALNLRYSMEFIWNYRDTADMAILGSSRSQSGLSPDLIKNAFAVNLSNVPNSIFESEFLLENYVLLHMNKLKYVVLALDIDMWWKVYDNSWTNFFYQDYKNYPGYVYDEDHDFWASGYPEGLAELADNSFGSGLYEEEFVSTRGFHNVECDSWEDDPATDYDVDWLTKSDAELNETVRRLKSMISSAAARGVKVIGIVFPQSPGYKDKKAFGRYGLTHEQASSIVTVLRSLEAEYPNFIFMDENKMGNHDYTDDMALNRDHLCYRGAEHMSSRLDSLIGTLQ